ncbi:MAG: uracil-DNA glycosylase family protein [Pseudomonadota bacterium]
MLEPNAQKYYLNVMGLPMWCLKEQHIDTSNQSLDKGVNLIPAGLLQFDASPEDIPTTTSYTAIKQNIIEVAQTRPLPLEQNLTDEIHLEEIPIPPPIEEIIPLLENPVINNTITEAKVTNMENLGATQTTSGNTSTQHVIDNSEPYELIALSKKIKSCHLCEQRKGGNVSLSMQHLNYLKDKAKTILLLVDTPTAQEYQQDNFICKAYLSLLMSIFKAVKLDANIYISSVLKCSDLKPFPGEPGDNSDQEINNCVAFLKQELLAISPDLIITLGPLNFNKLLEESINDKALEQIQGQTFTLKNSLFSITSIPVIPTFHPAFLYRNPLFKARALQNWIKISALLADKNI